MEAACLEGGGKATSQFWKDLERETGVLAATLKQIVRPELQAKLTVWLARKRGRPCKL